MAACPPGWPQLKPTSVPTPAEKAEFREAAAPVYDWFKDNVRGGEEIFDAMVSAVAEAEADIEAGMAADLN